MIQINATAIDLAYLAGIVDGEGCIGLYYIKCRYGKTPDISVSVSNTEPAIILSLHAAFGGTISSPPSGRKPGRRPIANWRVNSKRAVAVLDAITPYLRSKKAQAEFGLSYWRSRRRASKWFPPTDREALEAESAKQTMSLMKRDHADWQEIIASARAN